MPQNRPFRLALALAVMALSLVIGRNLYKRSLSSALSTAIDNNDLSAARSLLERGADPNAKTGVANATVLLTAIGNGNVETTRLLLDKGADIRLIQPQVSLALTYNDTPDLVNLLLKRRLITPAGDNQQSLVHLAVNRNKWNMVRLLLVKGVFPTYMRSESEGSEVLGAAAFEGYTDIVGFLLDKGINVNGRMQYQQTALQLAVAGGHADIVKMLLAKGADVTYKLKGGETMFQMAQKEHRSDIAALLKQSRTAK